MEKLRFNAKSLAVLLAVFFLGTSAAWANIIADGTVTDSAGEPLIGVSVVEKGASNGVTTDIDGKFRINVADGATLTFSYVGYDPVEAMAAEAMSIVLKESSTMLDEVVAVGYGTQKKSVVTAAIAKVGSDELTATAPVRMDNALKGLASGVTVTSSSGQPGAAARVRIRGIGTINNSDPLYIVDGMPIEGGLDYLNPNDIASIEVLKDAASAAIYGAQSGAGGVVLVTTKKAHEGPASLTYEGQYGLRKASNLITPLNAEQELAMRTQSFANAGLPLPEALNVEKNPWIGTTRTQWMDEIFRTAFFQRHNIVLNCCSETFTNRLSFNYVNNEGTLRNTYSKELGIRYNGSFKVNKWVTIREDLTWKNYESRTKSTTDAYTGPILSAIWMPASAEVYSPITGTWGGTTTQDPAYIAKYGSNFADAHGDVVNPVRLLECENRYNRTSDIWTTTSLEIANIIEGLRFTSRFTYNVASNNYKNFKPRDLAPGKPDENNSLAVTNYRTDQWNAENTLTYENSFGQHRVSGLFSVTANHWEQRYFESTGSGFNEESKYLQYLPIA